MSRRYDIAVIGAGPAGMAAAIEAAHHGASVALFDDQPSPGGQIYRAIATTGPSHDSILGPDYEAGRGLVAALAASTVERFAGATVWMVTPEREIAVTQNGESWRATASRIVLAPGAMERPFAIPGWTLPGVMTAGGAQNLLKASGLAAKGAVFAGSGPLLYLVAAQYVRAGVPPKAVIDMTPWSNRAGALRHAVGALRGWPTLWKGVGLIAEIRRARVPIIHGVTQLRVEGGRSASGLSWYRNGTRKTIETGHVFLHLGIVPNVNPAMAIGCAHAWDADQLCWRPVTDRWGNSSVEAVAIAGDGAGIGGAVAAEMQGRIAALDAVRALGCLQSAQRDAGACPLACRLAAEWRVRPFLDRLFRPPQALIAPRDPATVVCRCEEITAGAIRKAGALGGAGIRQVKAFTRAGMGACQGRTCAATVAAILAEEANRSMDEVGAASYRFPIKPVTLNDIAALADESFEPSINTKKA